MPEYLAPGVYVEETSFRAKSIEGVSTSTTGFVGPTRKGPITGIPELITSFGDFERIYGGFEDLAFGSGSRTNYLAHAVRSYFDNGGARLYVARVYAQATDEQQQEMAGIAESARLGDGNDNDNKIRFRARFPGAYGNGRVVTRLVETPATVRTMQAAPRGTMVRVANMPAGPASVTGGRPTFAMADGDTLTLSVAGVQDPVEITFHGEAAQVSGSADIAAQVTLGASNTLRVDFGSGEQSISLPAAQTDRDEIVTQINGELVGGTATLDGDRLVIASNVLGSASRVTVMRIDGLGFTLPQTQATNAVDANNNVADLAVVSATEIGALLAATQADPDAVTARASEVTGNLLIETVATGEAATVQVTAGPASGHVKLGLDTDPHTGSAATTNAIFLKAGESWVDGGGQVLDLSGFGLTSQPGGGADFITVNTLTTEQGGEQVFYEEMGFSPNHPRYIGHVLGESPGRRIDALENPFAIQIGADVTAFRLLALLTPAANTESQSAALTGGLDGAEPRANDYSETDGPLDALSRLDNISIVAAPGHSTFADRQGIQGALITHVERRRAYRVAVLDTAGEITGTEAIQERSRIDSTYAALYYPWVVVSNPLARPADESVPREIALPPSGFVCGIYARNDNDRGVHKSPANEVVRGALRFETEIGHAEQEVLNPKGINCLRFFPGRGNRVWGARTVSSDPEWKYVNVRRYFVYLEHSIDRGTQWAVFENNGPRLWANVRETIGSFLYNEWRSGALLGASPKEAYFVRCDRSTMTQNDLDNGRLICLIGVAVLKPAEFVIFRIGQKTADARG